MRISASLDSWSGTISNREEPELIAAARQGDAARVFSTVLVRHENSSAIR
jgi:hypothetical protein